MRSREKVRAGGFTLTELLVAISIIGLLVGLSAVGIPRAMEAGKKAKVKTELTSLVAAVKAYRQEYGRYPINHTTDINEYSSWYGPGNPDKTQECRELVQILSGQNRIMGGVEMNPKMIRFLEGASPDGSFKDPWGNQYGVKMDTSEDGRLEYFGNGTTNLALTVIAVSFGPGPRGTATNIADRQEDPDKIRTPACDDVFSWRN